MTNIGESIKNLRTKNNISQEVLAENLSISRQAISNWEKGKSQSDSETLVKLASMFNVSVDDILQCQIDDKRITKSYYWMVPILSVAFSILHFILAIMNHVALVGVIIAPMLASTIGLIMCFTFENGIKNRDFSMISGYKKEFEKDIPSYARRLRMTNAIISNLALMLNILYFLTYRVEKDQQMAISIVFFVVFILGLATALFIVAIKYKK